MRSDNWAALNDKPRRSVFNNFKTEPLGTPVSLPGMPAPGDIAARALNEALDGQTLQTTIDLAVARAFVYQFLARAFEDQLTETWSWLTDAGTQGALRSAAQRLANLPGAGALTRLAAVLLENLQPETLEPFQVACVTAFGHAARGDCPLNEIEYGELRADPLFQPHRLADLAAFYRAFGVEVADGAGERPDHLGMELEFMAVLAAKEAYALEHQLDDGQRELCRQAQKKFLREHLGRWSPAFARRLARVAGSPALAALAEFTVAFIVAECAAFGVPAGSEDLSLRPVDEAAESLCAACGLKNLPGSAGDEMK
jgi:DMSO reductase family type II enzyme chaperone